MKNNLFGEFNPVNAQQWNEKIIQDLKGADYEKTLISENIEGIKIYPFYSPESLNKFNITEQLPGEFPYLRGTEQKIPKQIIREDFVVNDFEKANKKAHLLILKGVNSFGFIIEKPFKDIDDFSKLFQDINLSETEINFISNYNHNLILSLLIDYIKINEINPNTIFGSLNFDPIGNKTISTKESDNSDFDYSQELNTLFKQDINFIPNFKLLTVNASHFKNAGSSSVQELAFALSVGVEYLSNIQAKNPGSFAPRILFKFGITSDYFTEIAKLRAARLLWAKIIEAYQTHSLEESKMNIHSETSEYNKTIYDPHVNILRCTTEAMSAIIGGTNSLYIKPYNTTFEASNEFSERIARNIQIILKEESHFNQFSDPAGGSYYIEYLTEKIAEKSWNLFLEIEGYGGYSTAFDKGFIKENIELLTNKRDENFALRKEILLGINQYPNQKEQAKVQIKKSHKTDNKLIKVYRVAEKFEEIRQKTERSKKRPKVFLFTIGDAIMQKAGAVFSENFFACGGFEIIKNPSFKSVKEGISKARKSKAEITVICSSDDEYPDIVPVVFEQMKEQTIIVVAGYPKNSINALQNFGIKHFIHLNSNIIKELALFQKELGI
jgi:methylmalonyl-CoA mutase